MQVLLPVVLLLLVWTTRLPGLETLPLHNDEGLHLTRAVAVWAGHPFWAISDGKIINHWPIALFYPQQTPVLAGRIATILVALIGLAAGWSLGRQQFGPRAALFAALAWIGSTYLAFYERLAFSDAQAGALVVVTLWAAVRAAHSGSLRDAAGAGLVFGLATLFKFTAAPYALMVMLALLCGAAPFRRRVLQLLAAAGSAAALFTIPLLYLLLRGDDFFSIALGWVSTGSGAEAGLLARLLDNSLRFADMIAGFGDLALVGALGGGALLIALRGRQGAILMSAAALPLVIMLVLGREMMPRHYVAGLPVLLVLGGAGIGLALERAAAPARRLLTLMAAGGLVLIAMLTARTASLDPVQLTLPAAVQAEHFSEHSSGYGLREAMRALDELPSDIPIIGSMFPDGCRRANFYAPAGRALICTDAPGLAAVERALNERGMVYVLTDTAPLIGLDVMATAAQLNAVTMRAAAYPRPGESEMNSSVVLWLLERRSP